MPGMQVSAERPDRSSEDRRNAVIPSLVCARMVHPPCIEFTVHCHRASEANAREFESQMKTELFQLGFERFWNGFLPPSWGGSEPVSRHSWLRAVLDADAGFEPCQSQRGRMRSTLSFGSRAVRRIDVHLSFQLQCRSSSAGFSSACSRSIVLQVGRSMAIFEGSISQHGPVRD